MADERVHDLFTFMQEVTDEMASEYERISARVGDDPGTAGDAGEENWADLMRHWLPPIFHVETKGQIVSHEGRTSPQLDVLVLHPAYAGKLRKKKLYMSTGVLGALECKLTLRSAHIAAFETASPIHDLLPQRKGNPHDELHHSVIYGLVAHSHEWKQPKSEPAANIQTAIHRAHQNIRRPCDMPEFVCVADLATWTTMKVSSAAILVQTPEAERLPLESRQAAASMAFTQYMRPMEHQVSPTPSAVGAMLAKLVVRLGFESDARLDQPITSSCFDISGPMRERISQPGSSRGLGKCSRKDTEMSSSISSPRSS